MRYHFKVWFVANTSKLTIHTIFYANKAWISHIVICRSGFCVRPLLKKSFTDYEVSHAWCMSLWDLPQLHTQLCTLHINMYKSREKNMLMTLDLSNHSDFREWISFLYGKPNTTCFVSSAHLFIGSRRSLYRKVSKHIPVLSFWHD